MSFNTQIMIVPLPIPNLGSRKTQLWLVSFLSCFWGAPGRANMSHKCVWLLGVILNPFHRPGPLYCACLITW